MLVRSTRPRIAPEGLAVALIIFAAVGGLVVAATPQLNSVWRDRDIRIDGVSREWPRLDELEKGPAVAVSNDNDNLYVIVLSSDPKMRQQLGAGIILWFDPTGGKKESFGIGIPNHAYLGHSGQNAPLPDAAVESATEPIDQFDVYGPGKNQRQLVRLEPALGIELAVATVQGTLAYELKLPLQMDASRQYAVNAHAGATIGFAVATPETPIQPMGGLGGPGGKGGRTGPSGSANLGVFVQGRGGMGGMGGRRGGGTRSGAESAPHLAALKIWTQLQLAASPMTSAR
jgi:hypothetical protein